MLRRRWPEVLETVKGLRRVTWILVGQNAQVHDLDASVLRLSFPSAGMVDRFRDHADVVARAVRETLGFDVHVQAILVGAPAEAGSSGTGPATGAMPSVPGRAPATPPHGIPSAEEAAASWDAPARPSTAGSPAGDEGAQGARASRPGAPGRSAAAGTGASAAGRSSSASGRSTSAGSVPPAGGGSSSAGSASSGARGSSSQGRGPSSGPPPSTGAASDDEDDDPDDPPIDMPDDDFPEDVPPEDIGVTRPPEEDEPSPDDPLIEGSNLVGAPLVARLLGGTVIEEQVDEPR